MNTSFESSFVVFPGDCNFNTPPSVFGGKVLSEMDVCAALTVRRAIHEQVGQGELTDAITVHVGNVNFYKGAVVGNLLFVRGTIIKVGTKSVDVKLLVRRELADGTEDQVADGMFRFVTRKDGVPKAHGLSLT